MRTPRPDPAQTGRSAKTSRSLTGVVLACARSFRGAGRGAPSRPRPRRLIFLLALATLAVLVAVVVPAFAAGPPAVSTGAAEEVGITTAKLTGTVNPEGSAGEPANTTWYLQVSPVGQEAWAGGPGPTIEGAAAEESNPVAVEMIIGKAGELNPGAEYEYRLYAENGGGHSETPEPHPTFTTEVAVARPTLTLAHAGEVLSTSAKLTGTVDPEGGNPNHVGGPASIRWHIQYAPASEPAAWQEGGTGTIEGGQAESTEPITVEATVGGLEPGTAYIARLLAEYAGSEQVVATEEPTFTTAEVAPTVTTGPPTHVSLTEATLNGEIDPGGGHTSYHFEYGTTAGYGHATPAQMVSEEPVHAQLSGLEAFTEYHYRLVATNPIKEVKGLDATFRTFAASPAGGGCANEAFRTGPSATLPDCRAYEMVTEDVPGDPEVYVPGIELGGNGEFTGGIVTRRPFQPSRSGEALAYIGDPGSLPGGLGTGGGGLGDQLVADRLPGGGWRVELAQPTSTVSAAEGVFFQGFSTDLTSGVFEFGRYTEGEPEPTLLSAEAPGGGYGVLYAQGEGPTAPAGEARYRPLFREPIHFERSPESSISHNVRTANSANIDRAFAGGSADFEDLLFETDDALLTPSEPHASELTGDVQGEIAAEEDGNYLYDSVQGKLSLVDVSPLRTVVPDATFGAPARDSPKTEFSDFDDVISADGSRVYWTAQGSGQVYLREDPAAAEECSAPGESGKACTVPVSAGTAPARYWTATPDGRFAFYTEGEGAESKLWRFDAADETRQVLTPAAGAEVQGVLGASADGTTVYFAADGDLTGEEENAEGQKATPGEPNLYLIQGGTTSFVTTLAPSDAEAEPYAGNLSHETGVGDWAPSQGQRTARLAGDGSALVFLSTRSLPTLGHPGGYANEGREEVYLYETGSGDLICASCSPTGEPGAAGILPISRSATYLPQTISEDGDQVFFDSSSPLVAADTNGAQDVYEWEREGTEGCTATQAVGGGCVHLLSAATSSYSSFLVGTSADGRDVFITTRAQLSSADDDERVDLYDARVGAEPSRAQVVCEGREECAHTEPGPPTKVSTGSSSFHGPGNPAAAGCRKGQVLKHGRCVKKSKKKHHKKKNGKKKNGKKHQKDKGADSRHGGHK